MIQVLIADDHQLMRQGLRALLEKAKDIQVIAEARDGREAVDLAMQKTPDVVLMDIAMPIMDGLKATEQISSHKIKSRVLMLSMYSDETLVRQALRNGACGYLVKNGSRDDLVNAIRAVHEGNKYFGQGVAHDFTDAQEC